MTSRSQVTVRTIWTIALHVLLLLTVLFVLHRVRTVIGWMMIALILALALDPVVTWLEHQRIRRGVAVLAVFFVGIAGMAGAVASFIPMVVEQTRAMVASAPHMLETLQHQPLFDRIDQQFDIVARARGALTDDIGTALEYLFSFGRRVFTGVLATVTIAVLCAFMLLFGRHLVQGGLDLIEPEQRSRFATMMQRIRRSVGGYVLGALIIASIGGVVTTVALLLIGVPYFLALGLMMIVLGLIPFIGAAVGGVMIIGTSFVTAGTTAGIIAAVVFLAYQQLENHVLQPFVQRRTIQMNPLLIVMSMLIGTTLLGILGALLALPAAGAIHVVVSDVADHRKARWAAPDAPAPGAEASHHA